MRQGRQWLVGLSCLKPASPVAVEQRCGARAPDAPPMCATLIGPAPPVSCPAGASSRSCTCWPARCWAAACTPWPATSSRVSRRGSVLALCLRGGWAQGLAAPLLHLCPRCAPAVLCHRLLLGGKLSRERSRHMHHLPASTSPADAPPPTRPTQPPQSTTCSAAARRRTAITARSTCCPTT